MWSRLVFCTILCGALVLNANGLYEECHTQRGVAKDWSSEVVPFSQHALTHLKRSTNVLQTSVKRVCRHPVNALKFMLGGVAVVSFLGGAALVGEFWEEPFAQQNATAAATNATLRAICESFLWLGGNGTGVNVSSSDTDYQSCADFVNQTSLE